jgi:hypothetical protein
MLCEGMTLTATPLKMVAMPSVEFGTYIVEISFFEGFGWAIK